MKGGMPVISGVGSTAVRDALEKYQPMLSLHGHIHESRGEARIGRTLAINPGSEYSEGVLRGAIITLSRRRRGCVAISSSPAESPSQEPREPGSPATGPEVAPSALSVAVRRVRPARSRPIRAARSPSRSARPSPPRAGR